MKIAIIDDSEIMRNKIKQIVMQEYAEEEIHTFADVKGYEQTDNVYDLLLLDIELSDEHGIEYIKSCPQKHRYVIYVTSYRKYMIDAFDMNVMGFVPKDQMEELLLDKIHDVEKAMTKVIEYEFHTIDGPLLIEEQQILYIYYGDQVVHIQLEMIETPIYLMERSLKSVQKKLSDNFYKVNRTRIVNMKKIRQLSKDTHEIIVREERIKVSDHEWKRFKTAYLAVRYHHD